jgi:hypothetical protein
MEKEVFTYTLKRPVTVGEHTCTELKFRRPKFMDFIAIGAAPVETAEAIARLVSSITGEPYEVIKILDVEDVAQIRTTAIRALNTFWGLSDYGTDPTKAAENPSP